MGDVIKAVPFRLYGDGADVLGGLAVLFLCLVDFSCAKLGGIYRGPQIVGTNGTRTRMASVKFQPHMLVQCVPSIGSRQNAKKNLLFVAICKSILGH